MNDNLKKKLKKILPKLNKRPQTLLKLLLKNGEVSTYDLEKLGYNQPPRAAQDLKEAGVKLCVRNAKHPETGSRMAVYTISPDQTIDFRQGRIAFPKEFSKKLFEKHGFVCNITGAKLTGNALQVDHRIPFIVRSDGNSLDIDEFQSLSASAQRSKSWACENCLNRKHADIEFCNNCFWAYPEIYEHVAGVPEKQVILTFQNEDVIVYDKFFAISQSSKKSVAQAIIETLRKII